MKKSLVKKLSLSRETLCGLADLNQGENLRRVAGGTEYTHTWYATENTCFETCYCRSGYTCDWSDCGCTW